LLYRSVPRGSQVDLEGVIEAIRRRRVRITDHADEEADADHLSFDAVFYAVRK